ncbi:MAG: hypothetical protein J6C77_04290 [Muribaculaceae bacterium]|nr:hypothetical protein [Muribaculaceae bacterium]
MSQRTNTLDLRRYLSALKRTRWILIPVIVIFFALGVFLSVRSLPKYTILGSMLIGEIGYDTENRAGGMAQIMKTFSVGGFGASTVDNEVIIAGSYDVMLRTVERLNLNRSYFGKDKEGKKYQLYKDTPLRVEAPKEYFDTLSTPYSVKIKLLGEGKADIKVQSGMLGRTYFEASDVKLPHLIETHFGAVNIMPVDSLMASTPFRTVTVNVCGTDAAASMLLKQIEIEVQSKLSDVIDVRYDCPNVELGKAVVDGLMSEYNAKRLDRLHEASVATIKYYDNRIAETFPELQKRENALAEYQRTNSLMGIDSETELLVGTANSSKQQIVEMSHNIMYYEMVLRTLRNRLNTDVIIPQMESLEDPNISTFNTYIMQRRELRRSATDDNEALQLLDEKIEGMRDLIIENSEKRLAKMRSDLAFIESKLGTAETRLDKYPTYQLEYANLMRDKEYTNSLYQYLVSQRENSVLQLYSNTNIGFVFQPAFVEKKPGILRKLLWPAALTVVGIMGALCLGLLFMWCSRKVKSPVDLAFIHCADNAVTDNEQGMVSLRNKLLLAPDTHVLYSADLTGTNLPAANLVQSLLSIGKKVEVIEGAESNDDLLTPDVQNRIAAALEAGADYAMVNVPEPDQLPRIETLVDAPQAALLLSLTEGKILRKKVKALLSGQTAAKVYTIIAR